MANDETAQTTDYRYSNTGLYFKRLVPVYATSLDEGTHECTVQIQRMCTLDTDQGLRHATGPSRVALVFNKTVMLRACSDSVQNSFRGVLFA